jgi:hypothetical protein
MKSFIDLIVFLTAPLVLVAISIAARYLSAR